MKHVWFAQVWALALNVFREATRDKMLQVLTGSGIVLMLFSLILGEMAVGSRERVVQNMGFWLIGIWGLVAVAYLGSNIVRNELQRHTVYLILSRPVTRATFQLGKFCGMLLVLLFAFVLLAAAWLSIMLITAVPLTRYHFVALLYIGGEWVLLAAFSLFFASFTSPMLHNLFLVALTFLGHWSNDLKLFAANTQDVWLQYLLKTFYYLLPNLEALNFREAALYNQSLPFTLMLEGALVLVGWIGTALIAANLVFSRRRLL